MKQQKQNSSYTSMTSTHVAYHDSLVIATLDEVLGLACDSSPVIRGSFETDVANAFSMSPTPHPNEMDRLVNPSSSSSSISNKGSPGGTSTSSSIDALLFDDVELLVDVNNTQDKVARTTENGSPTQVKRQQIATTRRPHKRPRQEVIYLRGKVQELEAELQQLQDSSCTTSLGCAEGNEQSTDVSRLLCYKMWKEMALHNQQEVTRSTVENFKLRAMVENQLRLAKQLETELAKRQCLGYIIPREYTTTAARRTRLPNMADITVFATLVYDLAILFHQTDEVLSAWERTAPSTVVDMKFHADCFELIDAQKIPVATGTAGRIMWQTMSSDAFTVDNAVYEVHRVHGDTVYAVFTATQLTSCSSPITLITRTKVRQFIDSNRTVFVSESILETRGSLTIRIREHGWIAVTPLDGATSTLTVCVRGYPESMDIRRDQLQLTHHNERTTMTSMLFDSYRYRMSKIHQITANVIHGGDIPK